MRECIEPAIFRALPGWQVSMGDLSHLLNAVGYAALGMLVFFLALVAIDRLTPYRFWREIFENKNVALAILVGALAISMSMIVAAAVH